MGNGVWRVYRFIWPFQSAVLPQARNIVLIQMRVCIFEFWAPNDLLAALEEGGGGKVLGRHIGQKANRFWLFLARVEICMGPRSRMACLQVLRDAGITGVRTFPRYLGDICDDVAQRFCGCRQL